MLNYLKIFVRNLKKHKVISLINIVGLCLGILSSLFIFEYVFYERSFDDYHENGDRVFRVVYDRYQYGKLQWKTANSFYPTGAWLKDNYSEVQDWMVISRKYNITVACENKAGDKVSYNEEKTYYTTNSIFHLFTIPLEKGDGTCLKNPSTVAISHRAAIRYFGEDDPIGKVLTVNSTEKYTVTAIFRDIPPNSHLQTDFLFSLSSFTASRPQLSANWGYDLFHTYILLAPGVDYLAFCKKAFPAMIAENYKESLDARDSRDEYFLQPLPDIHLHSNIEYETEPPGNAKMTSILYGFAIFLLIVAWINYINLVTAQSMERAREIGIRKVNGARKVSLTGQFIFEAFVFNLFCLVITFGLFFLVNPYFRWVTSIKDFNLFSHPEFLKTGILIFLAGILVSSIYPAFILSSYKPVRVLKGKFKNSMQGMTFRKSLVSFQFVISIVLLSGTFVTFRQASFLMKKDMGIDYNSKLVVRAPRTDDTQEERMNKIILFRDRIKEMPEVGDFTFSSDIPGEEINNFFSGWRKGFDRNDNKAYFQIAADDHFMDFYKVKVVAGRKFYKNETFGQQTILMNKLAADRFGYSDPEEAVGKVMVTSSGQEWQIVGVVDDFYYKSVKTEPVPTIITLNDRPKAFMTIRLSGPSLTYSSLVPKLRAVFTSVFPGQPFQYFSLDDKMMFDLRPDRTFASVFSLFSVLAILIAMIGITGLILITINQNMKEFGIRKALGAELGDVSYGLSGQLLYQFIVAMVIAVPLSFYGYKNWFLDAYNHHIDLGPWFLLVPVSVLALFMFFVILVFAVRVSRMNIRDVLQYE